LILPNLLMRRFTSSLLGFTLGITPVLTSVPVAFSQGLPTRAARTTQQVERVGNLNYHPTRRQLREMARDRQASDANTFLDYRYEYRELQQQRTLDNLRPDQRRTRLLNNRRLQGEGDRSRIGDKMMDAHERMTPRRAPGTSTRRNVEYRPTNKRSRPGEIRLRPERDPCLNIIGTRRSRCYYRLQGMTVPGS